MSESDVVTFVHAKLKRSTGLDLQHAILAIQFDERLITEG